VDDCKRNLLHLSAYHQRCRICELHIKLPVVLRRGKLQRFCQQCGRCHELRKFDGAKRSCKAQLSKHNARCAPAVGERGERGGGGSCEHTQFPHFQIFCVCEMGERMEREGGHKGDTHTRARAHCALPCNHNRHVPGGKGLPGWMSLKKCLKRVCLVITTSTPSPVWKGGVREKGGGEKGF
jgi:SBP domain